MPACSRPAISTAMIPTFRHTRARWLAVQTPMSRRSFASTTPSATSFATIRATSCSPKNNFVAGRYCGINVAFACLKRCCYRPLLEPRELHPVLALPTSKLENGTVAPVATVMVTRELDARLMTVLAKSCTGLPITVAQVRQALSIEDIEDWQNGAISDENLLAFAPALVERKLMEQGIVPDHYTEQATCKQCGPVWLWCTGKVLGCPWCWNRAKGKPVPCPPSRSI